MVGKKNSHLIGGGLQQEIRNGDNIALHQYNVELYNVAVSSISVSGSIVCHWTQIKFDFLFPF